MTERWAALAAALLAGVLLVVVAVRTVLAERRAGVGDPDGSPAPRSIAVRTLDLTIAVLAIALVAALAARIAIALATA
jgi:hypothetical protein